jgi:hypothetical protein
MRNALFVAAAVLASAPALAQSIDVNLADASCGQYIEVLKRADPGKSPTKSAAKTARAAQDTIIDIMVWVHGFQSGRAGPDAQLMKFDDAFIQSNVVRMAQTCQAKSPDGAMRLVDVARGL